MLQPTTYAAIDTDAIAHNARQVMDHLPEDCRLCAVAKCNGYGHGAVQVATTCIEAGAEWLGVSTIAEGVRLRQAGIESPVLVFIPPLEDEIPAAIDHDLTLTITSTAHVMQLQREGERQDRMARAHVYEDLGTAYLGPTEGIADIIEVAEQWPHVEIGGVYAHLGPPGSGLNIDQLEWIREGASLKMYAATLFEAVKQVTQRRIMFHVASSGPLLEWVEPHFDMVRIGRLLYGRYPEYVEAENRVLDLRPTFALKSRIFQVRTIPEGTKVGDGGEFVCGRPTRLASVPVGRAHGLSAPQQENTGWLSALIGSLRPSTPNNAEHAAAHPIARVAGETAPIVGRVAFDRCCLDVTDAPAAETGSEVTLPADSLNVPADIPRIPGALD